MRDGGELLRAGRPRSARAPVSVVLEVAPGSRARPLRGEEGESMKEYPTIPQAVGTAFREIPDAHVFDKLDGSNLRFEWNRKRGWHKFGTRSRLFDRDDWQFGRAIPIFHRTLAEPLARIFSVQRWDQCVVFAEHWGPSSFAGNHHEPRTNRPLDADEAMRLDLIDVAPHRQGILGPAEFVRLFGELPSARLLGRFHWTRGFVERVWNGEVEGVTFEGVVGKAGHGRTHDLVMAKAKTRTWIEKVRARHAPEDAERIARS